MGVRIIFYFVGFSWICIVTVLTMHVCSTCQESLSPCVFNLSAAFFALLTLSPLHSRLFPSAQIDHSLSFFSRPPASRIGSSPSPSHYRFQEQQALSGKLAPPLYFRQASCFTLDENHIKIFIHFLLYALLWRFPPESLVFCWMFSFLLIWSV
jgi:hypothetical protein